MLIPSEAFFKFEYLYSCLACSRAVACHNTSWHCAAELDAGCIPDWHLLDRNLSDKKTSSPQTLDPSREARTGFIKHSNLQTIANGAKQYSISKQKKNKSKKSLNENKNPEWILNEKSKMSEDI